MFTNFSKPPQHLITQNSIWTVPWLSQSGGQSVGQPVSRYCLILNSGFIHRPVEEGYVVYEGSLGHVFSRYLGFPLSGSFYGCSKIIFYSPTTATV